MVIIIGSPKPIKYLGPAKLIAGQPNQILADPIGQPRKKLSLTPVNDGLRPRVYYTLTNFRGGGGGQGPLAPPPQYANGLRHICRKYGM